MDYLKVMRICLILPHILRWVLFLHCLIEQASLLHIFSVHLIEVSQTFICSNNQIDKCFKTQWHAFLFYSNASAQLFFFSLIFPSNFANFRWKFRWANWEFRIFAYGITPSSSTSLIKVVWFDQLMEIICPPDWLWIYNFNSTIQYVDIWHL